MNHFAVPPSEDESVQSTLKPGTSRKEHTAPPRRQHAQPTASAPTYLAAIGQRVRQARRLAGLSQHALARRVGYTAANAISKLENGRIASIDVVMLDRIADACGVNVRFLTGRPDAPDQQNELLTLLTRQTRLLEHLLTRLDRIEQHLGLRRQTGASMRTPPRPL